MALNIQTSNSITSSPWTPTGIANMGSPVVLLSGFQTSFTKSDYQIQQLSFTLGSLTGGASPSIPFSFTLQDEDAHPYSYLLGLVMFGAYDNQPDGTTDTPGAVALQLVGTDGHGWSNQFPLVSSSFGTPTQVFAGLSQLAFQFDDNEQHAVQLLTAWTSAQPNAQQFVTVTGSNRITDASNHIGVQAPTVGVVNANTINQAPQIPILLPFDAVNGQTYAFGPITVPGATASNFQMAVILQGFTMSFQDDGDYDVTAVYVWPTLTYTVDDTGAVSGSLLYAVQMSSGSDMSTFGVAQALVIGYFTAPPTS